MLRACCFILGSLYLILRPCFWHWPRRYLLIRGRSKEQVADELEQALGWVTQSQMTPVAQLKRPKIPGCKASGAENAIAVPCRVGRAMFFFHQEASLEMKSGLMLFQGGSTILVDFLKFERYLRSFNSTVLSAKGCASLCFRLQSANAKSGHWTISPSCPHERLC